MRNVLEYKTPSVSPENENNVLTITGAVPLTTACFEFQDEGDVNVFTACFPQSREYSAGRREAGGRQEGGRQEGGGREGGREEAGGRTPGPGRSTPAHLRVHVMEFLLDSLDIAKPFIVVK